MQAFWKQSKKHFPGPGAPTPHLSRLKPSGLLPQEGRSRIDTGFVAVVLTASVPIAGNTHKRWNEACIYYNWLYTEGVHTKELEGMSGSNANHEIYVCLLAKLSAPDQISFQSHKPIKSPKWLSLAHVKLNFLSESEELYSSLILAS